MDKKMDCRIIQDLLPLYVDGVTSNYTNQEIQNHLLSCSECRQMLEYMQAPDEIVAIEDREVDFTRKIRRAILKRQGVAGAILVVLLLAGIAGLLINSRMTPRHFVDIFDFSSRDVASCHIYNHYFEEVSIQADELMNLMRAADYYYDGPTGNVMHGGSFIMQFFDESGYQLCYFWMTDEYFLYHDGKTYTYDKNPEVLEYLESLFIEN